MFPLLWLHAGCDRAPAGLLVEPAEVLAGETVRVIGRDLGGAGLRLGDRDLPIEDASETTVLARVPHDTPPGVSEVVLRTAEGEQATGLKVTVLVDRPCTAEFRSNTRISVARQTVDIDRFWPDGRRQRWTLTAADLARVEAEARVSPDGSSCSAIYLVRKAGGRLLYDDDTEANLTERAHTIGEMLNLPVATADPRP